MLNKIHENTVQDLIVVEVRKTIPNHHHITRNILRGLITGFLFHLELRSIRMELPGYKLYNEATAPP